MERRVLIDTWQKITKDDFLKFGSFPQASLDTIVGKLLIPDIAFEGFTVVQSGPAAVTVSSGHLFNQGKVYVNDTVGGTTVDLLSRLPVATKRIITIAVWGTELDSKLEARTFLTDADTRATIARETATEHWRWANIGPITGDEGPDPQPQAVAADVVPVAYVKMTTTGVESITRATAFLAPTLRGEDNRLNAYDIWRAVIGSLLDTLRSDLAAMAARIFGLAPFSLVRQIAQDVGAIQDLMRLPQTYQSYAYDHFLTEDYSDKTFIDWLARIEEGVRFPPAEIRDSQLGLLNVFDELVINSNNVILPAWDHTLRIANVGTHAELSISQYQYQTTDVVQKLMARQVTRYGTAFTACSNSKFWSTGNFDWGHWVFNRGGEVFTVLGAVTLGVAGNFAHNVIRLQKVWVDTVQEPYWERVVNNYVVAGAFLSETFLNGQDGWLSKINVYFSKVAATGSVTMMICETTNGTPDPTKVIARSVVDQVDMHISPAGVGVIPTSFLFQPTFLTKGRYGIILSSSGNHYVWVLKNTNYVSGTLFYSTDGAWYQGDLVTDLAFEIYFCKFRSNMTKAQLQPLQLPDGIACIEVNADTIIPDGCTLTYEILKDNKWRPMIGEVMGGDNPDALLVGLAPMYPFRVSFVGTDSVQPAIGVAANSRVVTWRPGNYLKHISTIRTCPSSTTIQIDIRIEAWRGAPYHTFDIRLLHGTDYATSRVPDQTTSEIPLDDSNAIIYHYVFTGMGALTSFRLRLEGYTDNPLACFHVAERFDIEI